MNLAAPFDDVGIARAIAPGEGVGMPRVPASANKLPPDPIGDNKIIRRAKQRFERASTAESDNRKQAVDDLNFKIGKQWPADLLAARTAEKRPALVINKIPTFTRQITNDQRQNRPGINISPVGGQADKNAAKMYSGLIRAIEYDCTASIAYDTAFESAVDIGFGYWRILAEREHPGSFNQVLVVRRIRNAMTVYMDPDRQEPDGSDAKWCFISEMIDRDEFKAKWPNANPCSWDPVAFGDTMKQWITQKKVRVAEYFEFVYKKRKRLFLDTGAEVWEDELPDSTKDLIKAGAMEVLDSFTAEVPSIKWYKMTGLEILETRDWPGKWIPVVEVIGNETDIQGEVTKAGAIRPAKDPQRMKNYWATKKTEGVALVANSPIIMEEGQVEGHEDTWKMANQRPMPYLLYKGTNLHGKPAPPPQRQPFAGLPQGIIEAEHASEQDMMATFGIRFDATLQERVHDESGKALTELRRSSDLGSFHYVDNFGISLHHSGRIMVDLIPHVYDTKRIATIIREDGEEQRVQIDPNAKRGFQQVPQPPGIQDPSAITAIFNPSVGQYGVRVTIGPSYATKRIEASHSMMEFLKLYPAAGPRVADLVAKHLDWEGADEFAARLIPPELAVQEIKNLPPTAQALVGNLLAQLKQVGTERQALMKQVTDTNADRALDQDKINKDFDAKLAKIAVEFEKIAAGKVASAISELTQAVNQMREGLAAQQGAKPSGASTAAPAAPAAPVTSGGTTGPKPAAFPPA